MKTYTYKRLELELYDSIDNTPYRRFQEYNLMCLIDANIGSDLNSVDNHYLTIQKLLPFPDKAALELNNFRQNLHFILSNTSPELRSFACLVAKINGVDVSMKPTEWIESKINHLPVGVIKSLLESFKKKIEVEIEMFFPGRIDIVQRGEAFQTLKKRTLLILDEILGTDRTKELKALESEVYEKYRPINFQGPDGVEIQSVKAYEEMCLLMEKYVKNPREMTILVFYQALEMINKKNTNGKPDFNQ